MLFFRKKIRVGIIGVGTFALISHVPNLRKTKRAKIIALSRRNTKALSDVKELLNVPETYTDWNNLINDSDLDAVIISTAHHVHSEPAVAALNKGLHVLLEKPIATTTKDAKAVLEASQNTDKVLMIGYDMRYWGFMIDAKKALKDGIIGTIKEISVSATSDYRVLWDSNQLPEEIKQAYKGQGIPESFLDIELDKYWRRDPDQMGGGMFADAGSHYVDSALWLSGEIPTEVSAEVDNVGYETDMNINVSASLTNNIKMSISYSACVPGVPQGHIVLIGDSGTMTIYVQGEKEGEIWIKNETGEKRLKTSTKTISPAEAFVSAALKGKENLSPASECIYAVAFTEASYQSAKEHRPIEISL